MSAETVTPNPDAPAVEVADEVVGPASDSTAIALVGPLQIIERGLADLEQIGASATWDVETTKGEAAAREFRALCVSTGTSAEAKYTELNQPILAMQKQGREIRDSIKARVKQIAASWDAKIVAKEERKAREKAEREEAERVRLAEIRTKIQDITRAVVSVAAADSATIQAKVAEIAGLVIDEAGYGDFVDEAEGARLRVGSELNTLLARVSLRETEEKALAEQRRVLAEQQAEFDRRKKEAEAELQRQKTEVARQQEEAAEKLRIEQHEAADRLAAQKRKDDEERAEQKRRDDEVRAENKRVDDERRARLQQQEDAFAEERRVANERVLSEQKAEKERREAEKKAAQPATAAATAEPAAADPASVAAQQLAASTADQAADQTAANDADADNGATVHEIRSTPSDAEILDVLCKSFDAHPLEVLDWIEGFNIAEQTRRVRGAA